MLYVCSLDGPLIDHAYTCPKGAFPIFKHNRTRGLVADLLTKVCPCVTVEPVLQPLSGEKFQILSTNVEDNARLDVSAQELKDKRRKTVFFDVKVFNAHALSNCTSLTASCYHRHELEKRRKYERRVIEVEHGTFTPFFISSSGGMGPSATVSVKTLASLLAKQSNTPIL